MGVSGQNYYEKIAIHQYLKFPVNLHFHVLLTVVFMTMVFMTAVFVTVVFMTVVLLTNERLY